MISLNALGFTSYAYEKLSCKAALNIKAENSLETFFYGLEAQLLKAQKFETPSNQIISLSTIIFERRFDEGDDQYFLFMRSQDGEEIGYIVIDLMFNAQVTGDYVGVRIHDSARGLGLGTLLYLKAASDLYKLTKEPLQISDDTSTEADALWNRFLDFGLTDVSDTGQIMLSEGFLNSEELSNFHQFYSPVRDEIPTW